MASLEYLAQGTANEAFSRGWCYQLASLRANGFQFPHGLRGKAMLKANSKFNGGMGSRIVVRLEHGDRLFRFTGRKSKTLADRLGGEWWMDHDSYLAIRKRSGPSDTEFRRVARANLAVLPEWGDMSNFATGRLTKDYWAFKGMSAPAAGKTDRSSGHFTLDILQIFVPGGLRLTDFEVPTDAVLTRLDY